MPAYTAFGATNTASPYYKTFPDLLKKVFYVAADGDKNPGMIAGSD